MSKHIKIGESAEICAPKSGYHGELGMIREVELDPDGNPAAIRLEIDGPGSAALIWFAASAVKPMKKEQTA